MSQQTSPAQNSDSNEAKSPKRRWRMSRRGFLIGLGATGASLALGWRYGVPSARLQLANLLDGAAPPGNISAPPQVWFEILADNTVRLFIPKVEMGQGIHTALAQIAAEDLEIKWAQVQVQQTGTGQGLDDPAGTGASTSVSSLYLILREAAATMRQMLINEAATQLGRPASELVAQDGTVFPADDPTQVLTYGDIVAQVTEWTVPEETPALKPASEFRYIGQSMDRVDFVDKLIGKAVYGYDARLPEMLYGAVARPATVAGKLLRAAPGSAASQPGVVQVVTQDDFAGVAAESRAQAHAALNSLEVEWDPGELISQAELDARVTVGQGKGTIVQKQGNPADILRDNTTVWGEYRTPLAAHAHLEAQAALVHVQADKIEVWASTQTAALVRNQIAERLGRDPESIIVHVTYLGGGFGRKLGTEAAVEAAVLSQATGRPVHVGWTRTEDMRHGYFRPPTHHILRATLSDNGRLEAIEHQQASSDVSFPFLPGIAKTIMGADFGAWRGATIHYGGIPHRGTTAWHVDLPLRTGWWRGLGLLANVFATESFMDEVAHTAGADPLAFRLAHCDDSPEGQRFKRALEVAAERANWGGSLPEGHALGIACSTDVDTIAAQVAEVSVETDASGQERVKVHRVWASMDPGLVINPDGAKAQTEGSVMMGLSSTLLEAITLKEGRIEAANFDRYPLLTIKDSPVVDVVLLESDGKPRGVGEPPLGPVAAAVNNAVFALTGKRLRQLPLKLT